MGKSTRKSTGKNPGMRRTFSVFFSKTFCTTIIVRKKRGKPKKVLEKSGHAKNIFL